MAQKSARGKGRGDDDRRTRYLDRMSWGAGKTAAWTKEAVFALVLALGSAVACPAGAQERHVPSAVREWDPSPAAVARDLLVRARALDAAALVDERAAAALALSLPELRSAAERARARAEEASAAGAETRAPLAAEAENLETDVAISELEAVTLRDAAAASRQRARELRARALLLVQGASALLPRARGHESDIF
jgi:hypothetical protein